LTVSAAKFSVPGPGLLGNGALLSEVSPGDKPWDTHKGQADKVARLYEMASRTGGVDSSWFARLGERMRECSHWLEFGLNHNQDGEVRLRLRTARFCRVRYDPLCQWRRELMWVARLMKFLNRPEIKAEKGRWIMLTLTVPNVPIGELRSTLDEMNIAWKRLIQRKAWPAKGFIRSTEITRRANDYAHPHFHAVMLVPPSYFSHGYISQKAWTALWREALRADYDPIVHVKVFKSKIVTDPETGETTELAPIEGIKYPVKPDELIGGKRQKDAEWLAELTRQTHKRRFIATGGILKDVLRDEEETNDDLLRPGEESSEEEVETLMTQWYLWFDKRYRKRSAPSV